MKSGLCLLFSVVLLINFDLFSLTVELNITLPLSLSLSLSSVAVVKCAGALAELYPAAFITEMIPRLKKEMFSGKTHIKKMTCNLMEYVATLYR